MNLLLIASLFIADTVVYPLSPEKVDPSTVAVTNEFRGAWWNKPYHERYRILVDFDFDGHDDMLLSEPMADFGTGGGLRFWYYWHSSCREGTLGYYIISANGVKDDKSQRFSITMDSDENDVALQLYRTALKDHGIPYRYEESLTRNGMVTWRPSRQREVLGK